MENIMKKTIDNNDPLKIIKEWEDNETKIVSEGVPLNPEYIYRKSGEWKGWNDFLGTAKSDPAYNINIEQDDVEDIAFAIISL